MKEQKYVTMKKELLIVSVFILSACSTSFEQIDSFQRDFNSHAEGWLNLVGLLTIISGWLVTMVSWLRKHFEFRSTSNSDVKGKRPILPFITINGKSLFRQFTRNKARATADTIAKELLDVNTTKGYDPTLIVGIGRGGGPFMVRSSHTGLENGLFWLLIEHIIIMRMEERLNICILSASLKHT